MNVDTSVMPEKIENLALSQKIENILVARNLRGMK
ncbi:MAG: hypothetical protein ACI9IJ_001752, partial [Psychromonas sp.]